MIPRISNPARTTRRRGFTAVEIAMVATVIAIIALLVLPLFRKRVTEAKISAAHDEVASIAKAQLLAEADIGFHVRLQDLDNGEDADPLNPTPLTQANTHILPPIALWNGTLEGGVAATPGIVPLTRTVVLRNWHGPYASVANYAPVVSLIDYWYGQSGAGAGFVFVVGNSQFPAFGAANIEDNVDLDRYPVDPWGQPYAFFGNGQFPANSTTESTFNYAVVSSFGPNGVVGKEGTITATPGFYRRYNPTDPGEAGMIGDETLVSDPLYQSDDIIYRF